MEENKTWFEPDSSLLRKDRDRIQNLAALHKEYKRRGFKKHYAESQIQAIKTIIQSQTPFYVVPSQDFKEGEYVQITQGALTGQIGQIQSSGQQKNFYIRIDSLKMDLIVNAPKEYLITASRKNIKKSKI